MQVHLQDRLMTEYRQNINLMIDKMKAKEKELMEEVDELQQ